MITYQQLIEFLRQKLDLSIEKMLFCWFFEPANRFDPAARTMLKREFLFVLSYLLLIAGVFAVFNLPW
jgi:hypothetical protein